MVTYDSIMSNATVNAYIRKADQALSAQGFTEHSFAHVGRVSQISGYILEVMGADAHQVELVRIASYLHEIGNLVNRVDHSQSGAVMAERILSDMGMEAEDVATVVAAIGNHDEGSGVPIDSVSAALILADKSDVRRSRVRNPDNMNFDIHDRVNYSVTESGLEINDEKTEITLNLTIDTAYGSVMDYFEIFLGRMILCRKAAEKLGLRFRLCINGQQLI